MRFNLFDHLWVFFVSIILYLKRPEIDTAYAEAYGPRKTTWSPPTEED